MFFFLLVICTFFPFKLDMDAFVKALQKSKESASESSKDKKDQDKDEDMALD